MKPLIFEDYAARFAPGGTAPSGMYALSLAEAGDFSLPRRAVNTHKYSYGRAVLIGGCVGYAGASVLAANACERSGAGLTHLFVPVSIYPVAAARVDGAIVTPLPADPSGGFSADAAQDVLPSLENASSVVIGPGLGRGEGARALTRAVIRHARCPLVLDADALMACAGDLSALDNYPAPVILTPHEGEFARLGGDLSAGRLTAALAFSRAHPNVILVLKGYGTLVCRGESVSVNPTGSAAMAKGGSGDVLSGVLGALLAQGFEAYFSARCAVYLHGLAGDMARDRVGEYSLTPSDMIASLPEAFKAALR